MSKFWSWLAAAVVADMGEEEELEVWFIIKLFLSLAQLP